jgi:branched-chain amino acid transport system substrate-binding protein
MPVQPLPVLAAQRRHLVQLGALMGLWPAWMGAQGSGDAVVRLVSHGDESGPNKPQYLPWIAGAKAVFERANRDRSLGVARIELIHRDTGGKKDASIELTKKSLAEDNAHAFFGFGGGPVLEAALPLMTEARMPMIGSFTGADTTRGASPYMFHTRPAFNVEVEYVVRHMATLGYKKVAVVAIDRPIGTGGLAQIGKIEHTLGLTWQKLSFKQDLSDMEAVTTAITNGQTQACLVLAIPVHGMACRC